MYFFIVLVKDLEEEREDAEAVVSALQSTMGLRFIVLVERAYIMYKNTCTIK
jgi:hypothetical protein